MCLLPDGTLLVHGGSLRTGRTDSAHILQIDLSEVMPAAVVSPTQGRSLSAVDLPQPASAARQSARPIATAATAEDDIEPDSQPTATSGAGQTQQRQAKRLRGRIATVRSAIAGGSGTAAAATTPAVAADAGTAMCQNVG